MPATLSLFEVVQQKKATEKAIAKLLSDLEQETGVVVRDISLINYIGQVGKKVIRVSIETIL